MRLTCPNCGAVYETPEGMVSEAGRHVQCSACHTRWFVRGTARTAASEEQILTRLENWRPRPAAAPPRDTGDAVAPARPAEPLRVVPTATVTPLQREQPTKPAERPTVARPAPVPEAPPRPAPRLDLHAPRVDPEQPPPAPRSQALPGFLLVLALAVLAFVVYRFEDEIAATVPAAGPALDAYATTVDGWRTDLEDVLAPYREGGAG